MGLSEALEKMREEFLQRCGDFVDFQQDHGSSATLQSPFSPEKPCLTALSTGSLSLRPSGLLSLRP
jgi:hypothetical protein